MRNEEGVTDGALTIFVEVIAALLTPTQKFSGVLSDAFSNA